MNTEKTIDTLNKLVVTNSDRIEGYDTASDNTDKNELKTLFSKFAQTSQTCRHELVREIKKLDGKAEEGTKASGKFFRAWMDVKSALAGNDRKAVLNSCEEGEERAIESYEAALEENSEYLTSGQQSMVRNQLDSIKSDRNKIRSMQNVMTELS